MFPCPICDVKLNSAEQRRAHCLGKNHIKREEARKKAEELGTDFDNTPDHCEVCNVPLTSQMTAIDHFNGKMHQKKVKAVQDQRLGFKTYCDICEVRLQSLKVSEAHFNGKLHCKREGKSHSAKERGRKIPMDRKSSNYKTSRPTSEAFSPSQNIFGLLLEETSTISTSWENPNCDKELEPKDLFSEFRSSLSGIKYLNSPSNTSSSSSPESSSEPFFSFDIPVTTSALIPATSSALIPTTTSAFIPASTSAFIPATTSAPNTRTTPVHETSIPRTSPRHKSPVLESTSPVLNGLTPFFEDLSTTNLTESSELASLWDPATNCKYSNETNNPSVAFPNVESDKNGVAAQSENIKHTQAIVHILREVGQGISSGDIAMRIAGLSPSDVNLILRDLEKHNLVFHAGHVPILWSLIGANTKHANAPNMYKRPNKVSNGLSHPEKIPITSPKETQVFKTSPKNSYFNQNLNGHNNFSPEACTTAAILASRSINTTTIAPTRPVYNYSHVTEPNLLNLFQQNASLALNEMKVKLNAKDDGQIRFILQKLVEGRVLAKDGATPPRWQLVSSTRSNVGVIGEERKRRSPVQNERSETAGRDRTPTPPKLEHGGNQVRVLNGYHAANTPVTNGFLPQSNNGEIDKPHQVRVSNGYHLNKSESNGFIPTAKNGYHTNTPQTNGFLPTGNNGEYERPHQVRVLNGYHLKTSDSNGFLPPAKNVYHSNTSETNGFLPQAENGYVEHEKPHLGFWQEVNNINPNYGMNVDAFHERHVTTGSNKHHNNRASPPLPLKTEACEVLDDLTVTTPNGYQKELYEVAMQEDTVCYLPSGTGKDLVMAQVIGHMAILNPTKQALVVVPDIISALDVAQVLRKEFGAKSTRSRLNVALHAGQLKQSTGKVQVAVVTSSTCLGLLNCGALSWKDVCLLIFDQAIMCCNDEASRTILQEYYLKAKMEYGAGLVPKLLSFIDSSSGKENLEETMRVLELSLATMGDVSLSLVSESMNELEEAKHEAMFVCVQSCLSQEEARMFFLLGMYLNLVFDNLAAQWQPLNTYRELLKISFKESSVISEAFVKLIRLTGQPLEKRLPTSCLKTWRHYLGICEVIFALVECGEDVAKEILGSLSREQFGFSWANDVGLPGFELSRQLLEKEITNRGSRLSNPRGSGVRELLEQLMIIQWENARVSSERPLAIVIVKLNKTAKILANYLARCPELVKRNVKTAFVDGSWSHHQKAVISAIKRRQYQVIVSTDSIEDNYELPHCELVVLLDEPSSEYALEQLRRRRATNVVAICRADDGEHNLKDLLRREELVEKSINILRAGGTS